MLLSNNLLHGELYDVALTRTYNKNVKVFTDIRASNSFIVTNNGKIIKRVYQLQDGWYVWDEKLSFREKVDNFTMALLTIEDELKRCRVV